MADSCRGCSGYVGCKVHCAEMNKDKYWVAKALSEHKKLIKKHENKWRDFVFSENSLQLAIKWRDKEK